MTGPAIRPGASDKRRTFRPLHGAECFVIPRPRDVGAFVRAADEIAETAHFNGFANASGAELDRRCADGLKQRARS